MITHDPQVAQPQPESASGGESEQGSWKSRLLSTLRGLPFQEALEFLGASATSQPEANAPAEGATRPARPPQVTPAAPAGGPSSAEAQALLAKLLAQGIEDETQLSYALLQQRFPALAGGTVRKDQPEWQVWLQIRSQLVRPALEQLKNLPPAQQDARRKAIRAQRQPRRGELQVTVDQAGKLLLDGQQVGFRLASGAAYLATVGKEKGVPLVRALVGELRTAQGRTPLYGMESVSLLPVREAGGEPPAGAARYKAQPAGKLAGLTLSGTKVLEYSSSWSPIAVDKLAADVRAGLDADARIDLTNGEMWVWMSFALRDETTAKPRWVPPGHSKREVQERQGLLQSEAQKLPKESEVRQAIDQHIRIISLVSSVEGGFGSTSPKEDTYGSLGIFQWAMPKNASADAGSLGMFFRNLKERAVAAQNKQKEQRTAEDNLAINAWAQCRKHGLDVKGKQILLNGKPATGGALETEMKGEMAKGDLRTYQLVAALDWIEQFKGTIVRPGPSIAKAVGSGYQDKANGAAASLTNGNLTLELTAQRYATVGKLFTSEKSLAHAVMLGVNRPHYVEASLWRALQPQGDPAREVAACLGQLAALLEQPAPQASSGRRRRSTKRTLASADVQAAGPEAQKLLAQLEGLLWPDRQLDAAGQAKLEAEFKNQALKLYSPSDARKYKRERRFSTVATVFE